MYFSYLLVKFINFITCISLNHEFLGISIHNDVLDMSHMLRNIISRLAIIKQEG